nr:unnamed protein product [Digitaria exilis]
MATSNKFPLPMIALLVAFAVALHPSSATRVEEAFFAATIAAKSAAAGPASAPSSSPPSDGGGDGLPPLPPQPRECRPWLMRMMPCASFMTNSSVYTPEATCCEGFNSMFTNEAATCLCHVANGDIAQLLPAPMIHMRMEELFSVCGHDVNVDIFAGLCSLMDIVPPIDLPSPAPSSSPMSAPAPAPSAGWP